VESDRSGRAATLLKLWDGFERLTKGYATSSGPSRRLRVMKTGGEINEN
jgi:hypothetical protein